MKIKSATFERSAPDLQSCPPEDLPEVAFIGRSNVGKSSLLNALVGKKGLARVSDVPGYTKMINFFVVNRTWRLVDLPGYGFAHVARENKARFNEAVNDYLLNRPNLSGVFILIDSQQPPQTIDLEFVHWFGGQSIPLVLVFTKTDKVRPELVDHNINLFKEHLAEWFEALPEIYRCSSLEGRGMRELLEVINAMVESA